MIRHAHENDIPSISYLHLQELPHTKNAQIGEWFIADLYRILLHNPEASRVWIFEENDTIIGLISTTSNRSHISKQILSSLTWSKWRKIALYNLRHPIQTGANLLFSHRLKNYCIENEEYILTLAVDKTHQRKAIGSALLQHVEAEAKKQRRLRIQVDTAQTNLQALHFYLKNRYSIVQNFLNTTILRKDLLRVEHDK